MGPLRLTSPSVIVLVAMTTLAAVGCTDAPASPTTSVPFSQTDLLVGIGADALNGATVTMNYTGWLYEGGVKGSKFDSSKDRRDPFDHDPPARDRCAQDRLEPALVVISGPATHLRDHEERDEQQERREPDHADEIRVRVDAGAQAESDGGEEVAHGETWTTEGLASRSVVGISRIPASAASRVW